MDCDGSKSMSAHTAEDLCKACQQGDVERVHVILTANTFDATWVDEFGGFSALYWSAYLGHSTITEALLTNARIDPMLKAKNDMNAFQVAAYSGNKSVVAVMLCDRRIDRNAVGNGKTALQWAQSDQQDWDGEAKWCRENLSKCSVLLERDRAGVAQLLMEVQAQRTQELDMMTETPEAKSTSTGYPETVIVSGAGTAEANGTYVYRPGGNPKAGDTLGCEKDIYEHTDTACWLGFQDCAKLGHPEWSKWVLFNATGVLYAAHTIGAIGVPPYLGKWEEAQWATRDGLQRNRIGAQPLPSLRAAAPAGAQPLPSLRAAAPAVENVENVELMSACIGADFTGDAWNTRQGPVVVRRGGKLSSLTFQSTCFTSDRPEYGCFKGEHHIRAITLGFSNEPEARFNTPSGVVQCNHTQTITFTSPLIALEGFRQSVFLQGLRLFEANGVVHDVGGTDKSPPCNHESNGGRFASYGRVDVRGAVIGLQPIHDDYTIKGIKLALQPGREPATV